MNTPIYDFVQRYSSSNMTRFHMPGHKGQALLGCEPWDITEIHGADALYEADGIIAESEANATALFDSQRTLYSTEGSSQCIRAMLYLAIMHRSSSASLRGDHRQPMIVAARNVHKAFVYAAALLDIQVTWLWPEETDSLCGCPVSPEQLEQTLSTLDEPPAAVYLTSPDYLGGLADISTLSDVCHRHGTLLLVDNAHGAYLRFLHPSLHPLDLGADMCCDSAHKTLPVLTGGAYLHIAKQAPAQLATQAKAALALFGSTSPSYLTLASLDRCNSLLAGEYPLQLSAMTAQILQIKDRLTASHWKVEPSDPLRLTLRAPFGSTGTDLAQRLREQNIECEYADESFLVLMLTPANDPADLDRLLHVLGEIHAPQTQPRRLPQARGHQACSIRKAMFAPHELISVDQALGRICGAPTVSCPPAIPIAVSGERISAEAIELFQRYSVTQVDVLKE